MATLKQNYEQKKIQQLSSKVKLAETKLASRSGAARLSKKIQLIESSLLTEKKVLTLLAETLDKNDIEQIQKTLESFEQIVPDGSALGAAVQGIRNELLKSMQGGLLNKIKDMLTPKNAKPIARAMAFLSSLKQGLSQMGTILKTALPPGIDLNNSGDKTLNQLINDQEKQKMVQSAFLRAIKPQGMFQMFSAIPYLDAKNAQNVAIDMMNMTGAEVMRLVQNAQGMQVAANKADVQAAVQTAAGKQNAAPEAGAETSPTSASTPTTPGEASKQSAESAPSNSQENNVIKRVLPAIQDIDLGPNGDDTKVRIIKQVLQALKQPGA